MKKTLYLGLITVLLVSSFLVPGARAQDSAAPATATEESPLSVTLDASMYSDYMFRGQRLYDGLSFQPSIQPSPSLGDYGNISGLLWFQIPAGGGPSDKRFFEMDAGLTYDYTLAPFTFSVGNLWYMYPNDDDNIDNTAEFFTSVAIDTMLTPTVSYYHDYEEFDYNYYELNLSHTFESAGEQSYNVTPFASFGFASHSEKVYKEDGLEQITFGLSTEVPVGQLTLKPILAYTAGIDDYTVDRMWMGTSLSYGF